MEISTAAPPSFITLNANATKSPDADHPADTLPAKSHPYTNGVLKKRHAPPHIHHPPSYKECLKNHAAAMGRHALDGCGEFMPSPAALPSDPTSLKCAACGCHRNFHRLDHHHHAQPLGAAARHVIEYHPQHRHHPPPPPPPNPQSPPPISSSYYPPAGGPHMLIALGGGNHPIEALNSPRKRFRTKFTQFQKEKMRELAEKLGWKMQKSGEDLVAEFCREVGVERGVFKVWMHNNKNTFQKQQQQQPPNLVQSSTPTTTTTNVDDNGSSGNNDAVNGAADGSSNSS